MSKSLIESIQAAGKRLESCSMPDGTRLLMLPFGARVLALYSPESEENFYWTNSALAEADTARSFFARMGGRTPAAIARGSPPSWTLSSPMPSSTSIGSPGNST